MTTITATIRDELSQIKANVERQQRAAEEKDPVRKLMLERGLNENSRLWRLYAELQQAQANVATAEQREAECVQMLDQIRAAGRRLFNKERVYLDSPIVSEADAARYVTLQKQAELVEIQRVQFAALRDYYHTQLDQAAKNWRAAQRDWYEALWSLTGDMRYAGGRILIADRDTGQTWTKPGAQRRAELEQALKRLEA